ncbi:hypothetical protein SLEP1_g42793 [Rubroshorea leprosula]|uniref:F-box/LRR-repeat protein 15/At3g58940/PEG3-like LRR domain-containing protein n=1 Tax=Rubroshorea leprosula TaxID=152421 RepID=A0AAV5LBX6_9ROSI|nr:hypothetical protein SLEP1_g42793 [Rubroshorea leprosula]
MVLKLDMLFPSGIEVPVKVCLPSLKVLHLDNVISFWDDDSANRLLSNCPVLEHLKYKNENEKENCKDIVSHPVLKSLDIDCMTCKGWSDDLKILIDAPSLVDLKYCVCDVNCHTFVNVEHLLKLIFIVYKMKV